MFYKQNSFSGRVSPSEAAAAYQPQVGKSPKLLVFCVFLHYVWESLADK